MRVSALTTLFVLLPAALAAQGGATLRFHPQAGSRLHYISDTRVTTVVVGFPSMPDSTPIESNWRVITTHRVAEARGTDRLVTARLDSSRARVKIGTEARTERPIPSVEGLSGRWMLSDRLVMSGLSGGQAGDSAYIDVLTSTVGGFRFTLPDDPVAVGGQWTGPFHFPLGAHLSTGGKIASSGSISGNATAVLDSLVPRGVDTLAYITVRAVADQTTLQVGAEGGMGTGTFSGGFGAALIWSTSWNAFVSAATNGRITGTVSVTRPEASPVNGALTITIAGRQQVRL